MDRRFKLARFSLICFTLGMVGIINTGFASEVFFILAFLALGVVSMVWAVVKAD